MKKSELEIAGHKKRIEELNNKIQLAQAKKREIVDYVKRLTLLHSKAKISNNEYNRELLRYLKGHSYDEWINYYNSYIDWCYDNIREYKSRINKYETPTKIPALLSILIILSVLGFGIYLLQPTITGYIIGVDNTSKDVVVDNNITEIGILNETENIIEELGSVENLIIDEIVIEESIDVPEIVENMSEEVIQGHAEINKPVKWIKRVKSNQETKNLKINIPKNASDLKVNKIINEVKEEINRERFLINEINKSKDESILSISSTENILSETELVIQDNVKDLEVEYYTEAPVVMENEINENLKEVTISSETHYENILAYAKIKESTSDSIKLYRINGDTREEFNINEYIDTNNNGLIDQISWIVPSLSSETYQIIIIIRAEHLNSNREFISDIYEGVKELDNVWSEIIPQDDYVRVRFERNLTNEKDITIYPRIISGNPKIEIYEYNKTELVAEFNSINSNEYNKILLTNLQSESQDIFDLKIVNGTVEFDHIIDPAGPLGFYVGNFTKPTSAGFQAISGLGFQPEAIIFFWTNNTIDDASVTAGGGYTGIGFASSPTSERAVISWSDDGGSSNTGRGSSSQRSIVIPSLAGGIGGAANISSFDSDGFTLYWDTANAGEYVIRYIALGGGDITNTSVGTFAMTTSGATQSVSNVGFQPDFIFFLPTQGTTDETFTTIDSFIHLGFASSATNEGLMALGDEDAEGSGVTCGFQNYGSSILTLVVAENSCANIDSQADLATFDTGGFTINKPNLPAANSNIFYLAIQGGQWNVGNFTMPTSAQSQQITGVGFEPVGAFFMSYGLAPDSLANQDASTTTNFHLSIGAAESTTSQGNILVIADDADASPNPGARTVSTAAIQTGIDTSGNGISLTGVANFTSFDADGFTFDWITADGTEREIIYWTVGAAIVPNTNPDFEPISNFALNEDFISFELNISDNVSDAESSDTLLNFSIINTTGIFEVDVNGDDLLNTTGNFTIISFDNITGTNTINITVVDPSGLTNVTEFTITINAVNDNPWWDLISNGSLSITEDTASQNSPAGANIYFRDVEDDQSWSNPSVLTNESDVTCSISTNDVQCSPANNFTGLFIATLTAYDSGSLSAGNMSYEINVNAVNDNPWANGTLGNSTQNEDFITLDNLIPITDFQANFSDVEDDGNPSTITIIQQTNTTTSCYIDGTNNLDCESNSNLSGTDLYTFELNDSGNLAFRMDWQIVVNTVNDKPFFDPIADFSLNQNFVAFELNISDNVTDVEDPDSQLNYTVENNNTAALITEFDLINGTGNLTFRAIQDIQDTNATINITVYDQNGAAGYEIESDEFIVTINAVTNVAPEVTFVSSNVNNTFSPNEGDIREIEFTLTVNDQDGIADISNVSANFTLAGEPLRLNDTCIDLGSLDANNKNFSCTIGMQYFDSNGDWAISIEANDSSGVTAQNNSLSFTYNLLTGMNLSVNTLTLASANPGDYNVTNSSDTSFLNVTNTGNQLLLYINVTGIDLGAAGTTSYIPAENFTFSNISIDYDGTSKEECMDETINGAQSQNLVNNTEVIVNGTIARGAAETSSLYLCLRHVPAGITGVSYNTLLGGSWTIKVDPQN